MEEFSRERLDKIIHTWPGQFVVSLWKDDKLKVLYFSADLRKLTGMEESRFKSVAAEDALQFIQEGDRPLVASLACQAARGEGDVKFTYRLIRGRGFVWVNGVTRAIASLDGCPVLLSVFAGEPERQTQRSLLDCANISLIVVDRSSYEILYANEMARSLNPESGFCGLSCFQFLFDRSAPCPWCGIPGLSGGNTTTEQLLPHAGKWCKIVFSPVDWHGRAAVSVSAVDISEAVKRQQSLEFDRSSLRKIVDNLPVGICVRRLVDGKVVSCDVNPPLLQMLPVHGKTGDEAERRFFNSLDPGTRSSLEGIVQKLSQPDNTVVHTFCRSGKSGERCFQISARSIGQKSGTMVFSCLSDVTRERIALAELEEGRLRYQAAAEAARLHVWEYDIKSNRIKVTGGNSTTEDFFGNGLPDMLENVLQSLLPMIEPADREKLSDLHRAIASGAKSGSCDVWFTKTAGHGAFCERISYFTVFDAQGQPVSAYGTGRDVTALKVAEEKYNNLYRYAAGTGPNSIGTFWLNLTKNICTEFDCHSVTIHEKLTEKTADKLFATIESIICDEGIRRSFSNRFSRARLLSDFHSGQSHFTLEYPVISSRGSLHWIRVRLDLVQNPGNDDVEGIICASDISAEKNNEDVINCITDNIFAGIGVINLKKRTIGWHRFSSRFRSLALEQKYDADQFHRDTAERFVPPYDREHFLLCASLDKIGSELKTHGEYMFSFWRVINGQLSRHRVQYSWLDRQLGDVLVLQSDITVSYEQEQKRLAQMKQALEAARLANSAKSDFVSRISHDIRTPLSAISSMTDFALQDLNDRGKLRDDLRRIKASNEFLLSLINDVLDISRIDSGNMELHPESCSVNEFAESIRNMFGHVCAQKGLKFGIEVKSSVESVLVDRTRLNQVMLNFVSNAVKYTPAGGCVSVSLSCHAIAGGAAACSITVTDTGIGMSDQFQKVMFDPFTQEFDNPLRPKLPSGSGLGLAIVRRIVTLMGGTLEVQSKVGCGTRIQVRITAPVSAAGAPLLSGTWVGMATPMLSGTVLLVEDNDVNTEIAVRLLEGFGLKVEHAGNGRLALEMFRQSPPGHYRAVLMDLQMPVMDGYDSTREIRTLSRPDALTVPIIAMTADAFAEAVAQCKKVGMNAHVPKPINPKLLRTTLERFFGGAAGWQG